ncbi:MAG: hypothetical protein J2P17_06505 [Mycobacterium sp.]|nr:hypothetical protein [Mycobacterium sp.]
MTTPSIADLTRAMKQLAQSGKDLGLSPAAHRDYGAAIDDYVNALIDARKKAAEIPNSYKDPGGFVSAEHTMSRLRDDVVSGFLPAIDGYIDYLHQARKTVDGVFNQIQAEDNDR